MRRVGVVASMLCAAALCTTGARAADDPYAALLAPEGTCGPAETALALDQQTAVVTMLCFTNYARAQSSLPPLQLNATLSAAGASKVAADVSCGLFSHEPCGRPFDSVFASYLAGAANYEIGENIAWGSGSYATARSIMDAWLHSSGHRQNILGADYKDVGIGYLGGQTFEGYSGAALWAQEFGTRWRASASQASPDGAPAKPAAPKKRPRHKHVRRTLRHT